jgi:biopolymer transport protein TolR
MRNRNKKRKLISDINVTPFVDILLVLLVIFMVAAPKMNSNIKIDLPKGNISKSSGVNKDVIISINSNNKIYIEDELIQSELLTEKLLKIVDGNLRKKIFIRADKSLNYGNVMLVIKKLNDAGFASASLITQIEK